MIRIALMNKSEISRIAEIDRSEHVTKSYLCEEGALKAIEVDWDVPRWYSHGDNEHSVEAKIKAWKPYLEQGGMMIGAFDRDLLVGFAILRPKLARDTAQFAVLHVSKDYRRKGIATKLAKEVCRLAVQMGARKLYVSATPSESAVGFYKSQGFEVAEEVDEELYALEPEDIHMIKTL